jgi:hypothetical protein
VKWNREACGLLVTALFDAAFYYAWCLTCYQPRQYMEKVCGEEPGEMRDFVCGECTAKSVPDALFIRPCPKCGVDIQKLVGCDHITCTSCGEHWCWRCGLGCGTPENTYNHMNNCRGDEVYESFRNAPQFHELEIDDYDEEYDDFY